MDDGCWERRWRDMVKTTETFIGSCVSADGVYLLALSLSWRDGTDFMAFMSQDRLFKYSHTLLWNISINNRCLRH